VLGLIVPNTHTSCLLQASSPLCHAHLHFVSCFSTWMYLFLFRQYLESFFYPLVLLNFPLLFGIVFNDLLHVLVQNVYLQRMAREIMSSWVQEWFFQMNFLCALFLPLNKYMALCIGCGNFQFLFLLNFCVFGIELCVLCEILCVECKKWVCWMNFVSHCGREIVWFWIVRRKIYWERMLKQKMLSCNAKYWMKTLVWVTFSVG
jgi:hypothetical protein